MNNGKSSTFDDPVHVPSLPGMSERVVRSQMIRWELSAAEYDGIVQEVIESHGADNPLKNAEAAIWGACRRHWNAAHRVTAKSETGSAPTVADHDDPLKGMSYTDMQKLVY